MIKKLLRNSLFRRLPGFRLSFYQPFNRQFYQFSQSNEDPKFSEEVLQKLKQDSEAFYDVIVEDDKPSVDLIDVNHFNTLTSQSDRRIIILFFFASWSPNTKLFKQDLFQSMEQYSNVSTIVNIDIEKHNNIASQFQLPAVPFAAVVFNNQIIDTYSLNQQNTKFLQVVGSLAKMFKGEGLGEILLEELAKLYQAENGASLIKFCQKALQESSTKKYHPEISLYQILGYLILQDVQKAKELIESFNTKYEDELNEPSINNLYQGVNTKYQQLQESQSMTPELAQLLNKLKEEPENKDLKFEIAEVAFNSKIYDIGIKSLLEIIKKDKTWANNKAQKKLFDLFNQLGNQNTFVIEGRKQLAKLLY